VSIWRYPDNPIIEPGDIEPSREDLNVIGVFNAGVTRFADEVILLLRVAEQPVNTRPDIVLTAVYDATKNETVTIEFSKNDPTIEFSDPRLIITPHETYLTSISHLRLARSKDGINFTIDQAPTFAPTNDYESFGIEDPRISLIGDTYYINYVAVSPAGVATCLASTRDFLSFERHGVIFCPDNKDVVIFPEKISNMYFALHRPNSPLFKRNDIWLAESPDLKFWGNHRYLMRPRKGQWDEVKIGASAVPFRIEQGWLEIYHSVDRNSRYCLGAVLLDSNEPWKILARSKKPVFEPEADYECEGFFGNVVFSCGLLYEDNKLKIYYGAADTAICYTELLLDDVLDSLNIPV